MNLGERVRIQGERGTYVVRGINPDGSLTLYGGTTGKEKWRAIRPERVKREQ